MSSVGRDARPYPVVVSGPSSSHTPPCSRTERRRRAGASFPGVDQRERVVFITGGAFTPEARAFLESLPPGRCLFKPLAAEVLRALVWEQLAGA